MQEFVARTRIFDKNFVTHDEIKECSMRVFSRMEIERCIWHTLSNNELFFNDYLLENGDGWYGGSYPIARITYKLKLGDGSWEKDKIETIFKPSPDRVLKVQKELMGNRGLCDFHSWSTKRHAAVDSQLVEYSVCNICGLRRRKINKVGEWFSEPEYGWLNKSDEENLKEYAGEKNVLAEHVRFAYLRYIEMKDPYRPTFDEFKSDIVAIYDMDEYISAISEYDDTSVFIFKKQQEESRTCLE